MSQPICRYCAAGLQLFKLFPNLPADTVLHRSSCLSGVKTYLPALCCRGAAVQVASKPICRHCVAEVQLFKQCRNLSAGTVLQGCSCLSGVETYLPALCCRGAAVKAVSKPICRHLVAEVQLFKQCSNLTAGHYVAGVQLLKRCRNLSAGTVLQGCSCLSGLEINLPGLCCRGAAV